MQRLPIRKTLCSKERQQGFHERREIFWSGQDIEIIGYLNAAQVEQGRTVRMEGTVEQGGDARQSAALISRHQRQAGVRPFSAAPVFPPGFLIFKPQEGHVRNAFRKQQIPVFLKTVREGCVEI